MLVEEVGWTMTAVLRGALLELLNSKVSGDESTGTRLKMNLKKDIIPVYWAYC